jgi:hypothetical protein
VTHVTGSVLNMPVGHGEQLAAPVLLLKRPWSMKHMYIQREHVHSKALTQPSAIHRDASYAGDGSDSGG